MANHVYFTIQVEDGLTDEQWSTLFKDVEVERPHWKEGEPPIKYRELAEIHEQPFMSKVDRTYDSDGWIEDSYSWYCDNCGAKWVNIEEWGDNGYISGYSAWSTPYQMVIHMLEFASDKFNIELRAKMTYEDEFRNFIGVDHFEVYKDEDDGEYYCAHDEEYVDGEDLNARIEEEFPNLAKDNFDWDEYSDELGQTAMEYADDVVYAFFENGQW